MAVNRLKLKRGEKKQLILAHVSANAVEHGWESADDTFRSLADKFGNSPSTYKPYEEAIADTLRSARSNGHGGNGHAALKETAVARIADALNDDGVDPSETPEQALLRNEKQKVKMLSALLQIVVETESHEETLRKVLSTIASFMQS